MGLEKIFWGLWASDTENDSVLPKVSTCFNFYISCSPLQCYESDFFCAINTMVRQFFPCFSVKIKVAGPISKGNLKT